MTEKSALLPPDEAAEFLGTTERHLRSLVSEDRIEYVKVGRKVRFTQKALDDFVKANTHRSKR